MLAKEVLEEKTLISKDKLKFMASLFDTLTKLKTNENIDDVYIYCRMDKLELYIFNFQEDYDTENFVTETLSKWEIKESYFPEVYINTSDEKMNILPRKSIKVC